MSHEAVIPQVRQLDCLRMMHLHWIGAFSAYPTSLTRIACLAGDCFGCKTIITASLPWTQHWRSFSLDQDWDRWTFKGKKKRIAWPDATTFIYTNDPQHASFSVLMSSKMGN